MRTSTWLALAVAGALATVATAQEGGTLVNLDGYKSKAPAAWKEVPLKSKFLRIKQFDLLAAKGDTKNAEIAIFEDAGGSVEANIGRWKGQFDPPAGKGRDEMATVRKVKIGDKEATVVEIEGTFKPAPFDPTFKGKTWPGFRLVAVQFQSADHLYHIKFTGPAATVAAHKKGFDAWLAGFKK